MALSQSKGLNKPYRYQKANTNIELRACEKIDFRCLNPSNNQGFSGMNFAVFDFFTDSEIATSPTHWPGLWRPGPDPSRASGP